VATVAIVDKASGAVMASGTVDASAPASHDPLGFDCAPAASLSALIPGSSYVLYVETACDGFYDDVGTVLNVTGGASAAVTSVYADPASKTGWLPGGGGPGHCYGPLNFYTTSA